MRYLKCVFCKLCDPRVRELDLFRLNIPNTTNLLDGGCFSPLKDKLKVHRGASKEMRKKMIVFFLENRRK